MTLNYELIQQHLYTHGHKESSSLPSLRTHVKVCENHVPELLTLASPCDLFADSRTLALQTTPQSKEFGRELVEET